MKRLILLALTAFVTSLLQSPLYAAEQAHDFARWEKEISAFEQADATNPPPAGGILFIGSSTIRMWKSLPQDFPGHHIINRGFGGSEIVDATHFADRIIFPYSPRMIFLRSGGNDIWNGRSPELVAGDFKAFVKTIHDRLPETEVVFIGLCPSPSRVSKGDAENKLNKLAEACAKGTPHVQYIELFALSLDAEGKPRPELYLQDRLHFNAEGYKLLADKVRPHLPAK